ncbi:MAG: cytochrome c biogenesis protein DipZ [Steroidobacteraceae bacterium]
MALLLVAYLGGVLTILSPCILPVLPFVLARADRRFATHGLPLLLGMAAAFVVVGSLAAVVGEWAVTANRIGRAVALVVVALFGLALLWPAFADRIARPLVALGSRLSQPADGDAAGDRRGLWSSLALGVATGLLWAPCAGPILGLIFGTAALQGTSTQTSLLLLAYALGAGTALAIALLAGGRVFAALKSSLPATEGLRRALGALVLVSAIAILLGFDTGVLARLSTASTNRIEQALLDRTGSGHAAAPNAMSAMTENAGNSNSMMMMSEKTGNSMMMMNGGAKGAAAAASELPPEAANARPSLEGGGPWINSAPLHLEALKGKVVLIDFWTYSCINCLRALPYVKAWSQKYRDAGLVVIGVHTPEFAFERLEANVRRATRDLSIDYPVVLDNSYAIWRAFDNHYWPAHYFIDATGKLRHAHFGEGDYDGSERMIQRLLAEAGAAAASSSLVDVRATGAAAAPDEANILSPETYVGYKRAENFVSPGGMKHDSAGNYVDGDPRLNEWGLAGQWTVGEESATTAAPGARIVYVFHARDLHLVLGPSEAGQHIRFRVTLDGKPPGKNAGVDVDADGYGTIDNQRLYQLIRQSGPVADHRFQIEFLGAGAQAYAFTFG